MWGFSWSERTNPGTNLSVSTFNQLIIAKSDLNETFRECLPDIPFGIANTIQNEICMLHFKDNEIFYGEIWKTLSEVTQSDGLN